VFYDLSCNIDAPDSCYMQLPVVENRCISRIMLANSWKQNRCLCVEWSWANYIDWSWKQHLTAAIVTDDVLIQPATP